MFRTDSNSAALIARLALGIVMFPHGAQKMLGWFGGYGFDGTMGYFTGTLGIPAIFAFLAILAEFAGSLGLITGFLSRVSALGIASVMAVAIAMAHKGNGFLINWTGQQSGEGYVYHLLAIALAVIVLIHGAGKASVDALLAKRLAKN
jgi:putative oxidoreductase